MEFWSSCAKWQGGFASVLQGGCDQFGSQPLPCSVRGWAQLLFWHMTLVRDLSRRSQFVEALRRCNSGSTEAPGHQGCQSINYDDNSSAGAFFLLCSLWERLYQLVLRSILAKSQNCIKHPDANYPLCFGSTSRSTALVKASNVKPWIILTDKENKNDDPKANPKVFQRRRNLSQVRNSNPLLPRPSLLQLGTFFRFSFIFLFFLPSFVILFDSLFYFILYSLFIHLIQFYSI